MSDRKIAVATIENPANTHIIVIEADCLGSSYVVSVRVWQRTFGGMLRTDLMGGAFSTTIEKTNRFNKKRLEAIAKTAMTLLSTQHDYERLIAKAEYAKLGFPQWRDVSAAA
jgi:hypothetical protein